MLHILDNYHDILSTKEVQEILHIGTNKVYELLKSGRIKSFRIGSVHKIPKWCLQEYIAGAIMPIHNPNEGAVGNDYNIEN